MSRSRLAVLLVLASLAPATARAFDAVAVRAAILDRNDPKTAADFLASPADQKAFSAADPELSVRVFERAAELADLSDLLRSSMDQRAIRLGLAKRAKCAFCQRPAELERWASDMVKLDAAHAHALSEAVADWNALPLDQQAWLSAQGEAPDAWKTKALDPRLTRLHAWAIQERDVLMKRAPGGAGREWDDYTIEVSAVESYLEGEEMRMIDEHYRKVLTANSTLADAEARLKTTKDPRLAQLLAQAKGADNVDAKLEALSRFFENSNAGGSDAGAAARALAPDRPGQAWNDPRRVVVADLLKTALPASTKGTWAGEELDAFYAKNPVTVTVEPMQGMAIALYSGGVLRFNEAAIDQFLKSQNRDIADLVKDKKLFDQLVVQVAPVYVHESTHYEQDVWAKAQGVPLLWDQHHEQEAMQAEALFVLQKERLDPNFAAELRRQAKSSVNAREALQLAALLRDLKTARFRAEINRSRYPDRVSLEATTWSTIVSHTDSQGLFETELARRLKLPIFEQASLELGPDLNTLPRDPAGWAAGLKTVGTVHLREQIELWRKARLNDVDVYRKYRSRTEALDALTEKRLDLIESSTVPKKDSVPPPGKNP